MPIITFHGTDDQIVKFNGGFGPIPTAGGASSSALAPAAVDLNGPGIPAERGGDGRAQRL